MDVEWNTRPVVHQQSQEWHDLPPLPHFAASSPPQTAFPASGSLSQRRRSSAAHPRPAGPPPNLPIPSVPSSSNLLAAPQITTIEAQDDGSLPSSHIIGRPVYTNTYTRPAPSPSLSAVAAFSQSRQAAPQLSSFSAYSTPTYQSSDDLSDPPPQSYLSTASTSPPTSRRMDTASDNLLQPDSQERSGRRGERSEHRPSSRRALTRALELAREAVQLDSTNDNPEAAVQAYARSVALLSEVMERVRRGEDSTESRRRRRRSVAAQEDEIRRLQNIHDTYADRLNILSIIYSIPAIPYSTPASYSSTSVDSTASTSPPTSASPSSDGSPLTSHRNPASNHGYQVPDEPPFQGQDLVPNRDSSQRQDTGSVYILDEQVLTGNAIPMTSSATHHPYAVNVDIPQQAPPTTPPRGAGISRRSRASSNLPPPPPPPSNSLPPAPTLIEPPSQQTLQPRSDSLNRPSLPELKHGRRTSASYLGSLTEENDNSGVVEIRDRLAAVAIETPRNLNKRESPPLPPLPSPPPHGSGSAPGTPRSNSFLSKDPSSPRLANLAASRPRGSSQLTTRAELANVPQPQMINHTTTQGTIYQRRTKTSAPPSIRSSSPTGSTASASSQHQSKQGSFSGATTPPNNGVRSRSSSQPGRRPSLGNGRASPPPLPNNGAINGNGMRKSSFPSKLAPAPPSLQLDSSVPPFSNSGFHPNGPGALLSPTYQHPTTPTSPLPPLPPTDPLLKPYHMMGLLRNTIMSPTGGYITPRLHVPCEVWSQGGAKLSNVLEKVRIVAILCSALDELQIVSAEFFGAGNVSSGLAMGIGSIGRKEAEAWLSKLDDFSSVCDGVVANFGKKLGVGEGFVSKKTTWSDKLSRRFDKFTNGKNLDSPSAYVNGLRKLFSQSQLLDEHTRALVSQPVAPSYAAFPMDVRISVEYRLKRCSEFFATVVLTFVIRDLSQLLDKYAKKCEKWLAE